MKNIEIVFVHLGESIPKYLILNLRRTKELFPKNQITLITDSTKFKSNDVNISLYKRSQSTHIAIDQTKLDRRFRSGFWVKSLERLIAVFEYQVENQIQNLIHFESDVLLMPNFPFELFEDLRKPIWTKYSQYKSVGAVVYIPTHKDAESLLESTLSILKQKRDITDMTLLNELSERLRIAETFSHEVLEYSDDHRKIEETSTSATLNNGFFDPAQVGMWLTGEDPRNHLGMNVIHSNELFELGESEINPAKLQYSLDNEHNLWASNVNGIRFPIWSLHIHSKNEDIFKNVDSSGLENFVQKSKNINIERSINFSMLCRLIIDNLRNRTLMAYTKNAMRYLLSNLDTNNFLLTVRKASNEKN